MTVAAPAVEDHRASAWTAAPPLLPLAEVALACVSLAAVLGMRRVFPGSDWFGHLGLQVVVAHAVAAGLRRRGVSVLASALITVLVAVVVISWVYAGETTSFGLPTGATFDALRGSVDVSATAFSEVKAPVPEPFLDGFFILTAIAVWIGAIIADWASFRVDAPLEAVLPSATLFVLGAVFGGDTDRVLLAGLWTAAVLGFVLLRRADRLGRTATWVGERRSTGPRTLVLLGGALALGAVVVAALLGPRLPGANSEAVIAPTKVFDSGPGTRVTVSPLVDIRSRLVDLAEVQVFTVRTNVPEYWRLTSLDTFDGELWKSNGSYGKASGTLDEGVPVESDRFLVEQTFTIGALSQIWLPAAYEPRAISSATPVRYDDVSGTLIVDTEIPTSDNMTYRVSSAIPEHRPEALATASAEIPRGIADTYLDLPSDFPDSVRELAQAVTASGASAYEKSRMLQDWFRAEFEYDLDVGPGHGEDAIEQFLFDQRRGYCEQFAGSFAAMARSLGIPARVAVGFTQGNVSPDDSTLYQVRGENAHAWPEVFLGEYGWVMFEPTPGRGAPFAEQHTGVPAQQVIPGTGGTDTERTPPPPRADGGESPVTTEPARPQPLPDEIDPGTGGTGEEAPPSPWPGRLAWTAIWLAGAAVLYLSVVLAVTRARRWRRHRAAVDASAKIALAWEESMRAVRRAGVPVRSAETQREAASRIGHRLPSIETPMRTLAITVQDVTFAPRDPDPEVGEHALAIAEEIELTAATTMSGGERFRTRFHPRRLLDS